MRFNLRNIVVKHNPKEPMTFEQAGNLVHEKESRTEAELRTWAKTVPGGISYADPAKRNEYLNYAVGLLDKEKYPIHYNLLKVKINMASYPKFETMTAKQVNKFIAKVMSGLLNRIITVAHVELYEREAIEHVQEEIIHRRATGIELVGIPQV